MFALLTLIVGIAVGVIEAILGIAETIGGVYGPLSMLLILGTIVPGIAVGIRRLHDTDRSGWWVLIALVPVLGAIVLLVFFVSNGTPGENQFGPDPKDAPSGAAHA